MNPDRTRQEGGYSLVELLFACGILVAVIAAATGAQSVATGVMNETVARSALQEAAMFGVKQVAFETRWCDSTSLVLSTLNGSSRIDLRLPTDFVSGAPVWSSTITYKVVQSSTDLDGNGVLDEWQLVRVQGTETKVICDNLATGGFTTTKTGSKVTLQVHVSRTHRDRPLDVTVSSTVNLRN